MLLIPANILPPTHLPHIVDTANNVWWKMSRTQKQCIDDVCVCGINITRMRSCIVNSVNCTLFYLLFGSPSMSETQTLLYEFFWYHLTWCHYCLLSISYKSPACITTKQYSINLHNNDHHCWDYDILHFK